MARPRLRQPCCMRATCFQLQSALSDTKFLASARRWPITPFTAAPQAAGSCDSAVYSIRARDLGGPRWLRCRLPQCLYATPTVGCPLPGLTFKRMILHDIRKNHLLSLQGSARCPTGFSLEAPAYSSKWWHFAVRPRPSSAIREWGVGASRWKQSRLN